MENPSEAEIELEKALKLAPYKNHIFEGYVKI